MSEHEPRHGEQFKAPEAEPSSERHEAAHHKNSPEHEPRHEKQEANVQELEQHAKEEAAVAKDVVSHEKSPQEPSSLLVSRELKQQTFARTMTSIRKHLPAPQRALSKVIHQPAVNAVSEASAKTVARPSGILVGSICAFVGSSFFLIMAKRYGFAYNYLVFALFFAGGFVAGLFLELIFSAFKRKA